MIDPVFSKDFRSAVRLYICISLACVGLLWIVFTLQPLHSVAGDGILFLMGTGSLVTLFAMGVFQGLAFLAFRKKNTRWTYKNYKAKQSYCLTFEAIDCIDSLGKRTKTQMPRNIDY